MTKCYEVETESGARYIINTGLKMMRRERSAVESLGSPFVANSVMDNDGQDHPYLEILQPLEVGSFLAVSWMRPGRSHPSIRMSTYITAVREWDVPPTPDQPSGDRSGTTP